jgi:transposase
MSSRAIPRDFAAMEQRRKRAAAMFKKGTAQGDVARELGVSRQSVSRWHAEWQEGGVNALRGAGRAGRLPRLNESDLQKVERRLLKGPVASGYPTELWTLERVAEVIEETTGVRYHPGHVWRVLRQLGWSRQRPARRALERNDEAIAHWAQHEWTRVKKTHGGERPGSASRTRAGSASSPR